MIKTPILKFIDYVQYYTGEFVKALGEGYHFHTQMKFKIIKTEKEKIVILPKENFEEKYIIDASIFLNNNTEYFSDESAVKYIHSTTNSEYKLLWEALEDTTDNRSMVCLDDKLNLTIIPFETFSREFQRNEDIKRQQSM